MNKSIFHHLIRSIKTTIAAFDLAFANQLWQTSTLQWQKGKFLTVIPLKLLSILILFLLCGVPQTAWALKYEQLPGKGLDIAVSSSGEAYVIGQRSKKVFKWDEGAQSWQNMGGDFTKPKRITVDRVGNPWFVDESGNIYRHSPLLRRIETGSWEKMPGKALDIGRGPDGTLWVVGISKRIFYFDHEEERWTLPDEPALAGEAKVVCGSQNTPWVITQADHRIYERRYRRNSALPQWHRKPGAAIDLAQNGAGKTYCIGASSRQLFVWKVSDNDWEKVDIAPTSLSKLAAAGEGLPWLIDESGNIHRPNDKLEDWSLQLQRLFIPNAQEDGILSDGDEPYLIVLGFRSRFNTPNSTQVFLNHYRDVAWAAGINGRDYATATIPEYMGLMHFDEVRWISLPEYIQGGNPEIIGQLVIAMESDGTPFSSIRRIANRVRDALQVELVELVEGGAIAINRPTEAMAELGEAVERLRGQLSLSDSEALQIFFESVGDADEMIGSGITIFCAVQGASQITFPAFSGGYAGILGPQSFPAASSPLVFQAEGATYRIAFTARPKQ